jgi:hypothetical protein
MVLEGVLVGESLAAPGAVEGPQLEVQGPYMRLQVVACAEGLAAGYIRTYQRSHIDVFTMQQLNQITLRIATACCL